MGRGAGGEGSYIYSIYIHMASVSGGRFKMRGGGGEKTNIEILKISQVQHNLIFD